MVGLTQQRVLEIVTVSSSESLEQQGFLLWWKNKFPTTLLFHIPNGGRRDIRTATRLKKEGVVKGIPDLFCPKFLLWIEMKTTTGRLSQEQIAMHDYLRSVGYAVIVAHGATDASIQILEFLECKK